MKEKFCREHNRRLKGSMRRNMSLVTASPGMLVKLGREQVGLSGEVPEMYDWVVNLSKITGEDQVKFVKTVSEMLGFFNISTQ